MKKLNLFVASILILFYSSLVMASSAKISDYLESVQSAKKVNTEKVDQGFELLASAVKDPKMVKEQLPQILRLGLFLLKNDPSDYAYELLYPVYKAEKELVLKVIAKWSAEDISVFMTAMQIEESFNKRGRQLDDEK